MMQRSACWLVTVMTLITPMAAGGDRTDRVGNAGSAAAEDLTIVPCLLPSRVRRLGGLMYPERRQLTKATARKCRLMGGEYTVYDRAAPEAAVAFFTPMATAGDAIAQTGLGEVYEYLFAEPRYADAAHWYRQAADQGDRSAMRRLAYLHERGLGVPADALLATNLWRAATGLTDELVLASELQAATSAAEQRVAQLTGELRARSSEVDALQQALATERQAVAARRAQVGTLERQQQELLAEVQRLAAAEGAAPAPQDGDRLLELERQAAQRERQIEEQQFQLASLEAALGAQEAQVAAGVRRLEIDNQRLSAELQRVALMSAEELNDARAALAAQARETARLRDERERLLAGLEARSDQADAQTAAAQDEVAGVTERLAHAELTTTQLQAQLERAVADRQRADAELAQVEAALVAARGQSHRAQARLTEIETALAGEVLARQQLTRQLAAATAATAAERERLTAALADHDRVVAELRAQLAANTEEAGRVLAETERLREQWSAQIATRSAPDLLPDTSTLRIPPEVKLGRYHALVIGNNAYQILRPLNFAHNDARALHELLTERYGFRSELLLDATRNEIFGRLEALSETLRPQDALLIYYAGHGVEDGRSSYWLGVDAPSTQSALQTHGVSSAELGQWLSVLEARHVMVIADSCYSGAGIETTGGMKFTAADVQAQLRFFLQNRARTALTSGGNGPVPDGGGGGHSVFTQALLTLLETNQGVLFDADLYAHLRERVRLNGHSVAAPEPVFGRIEVAGHGAGQFAFIRPHLTRS